MKWLGGQQPTGGRVVSLPLPLTLHSKLSLIARTALILEKDRESNPDWVSDDGFSLGGNMQDFSFPYEGL